MIGYDQKFHTAFDNMIRNNHHVSEALSTLDYGTLSSLKDV